MSNWKQTVQFEDEELTAQVAVPGLKTMNAVRVHFLEADELTSAAEAALDALLQKLPELEPAIIRAAFENYQHISKEFGRIYGDEVRLPVAANAQDLRSFYWLVTLYLSYKPELGEFGLGFGCDWEEEHGFGLYFRQWQIVDNGDYTVAFDPN